MTIDKRIKKANKDLKTTNDLIKSFKKEGSDFDLLEKTKLETEQLIEILEFYKDNYDKEKFIVDSNGEELRTGKEIENYLLWLLEGDSLFLNGEEVSSDQLYNMSTKDMKNLLIKSYGFRESFKNSCKYNEEIKKDFTCNEPLTAKIKLDNEKHCKSTRDVTGTDLRLEALEKRTFEDIFQDIAHLFKDHPHNLLRPVEVTNSKSNERYYFHCFTDISSTVETRKMAILEKATTGGISLFNPIHIKFLDV